MNTLALQGLIEETLSYIRKLAEVVEGDDPVDDDAEQVKRKRQVIEERFKQFMKDFPVTKSVPPSPEQLTRLEALKKEIARKDAALDALYKQLRDFELEVSLRSGGAKKRARERAALEDSKKALQRMQSS